MARAVPQEPAPRTAIVITAFVIPDRERRSPDEIYISTCPPTSTTLFGGMWKNSVASKALFDMKMNSLRRQRDMGDFCTLRNSFSRPITTDVVMGSKRRLG